MSGIAENSGVRVSLIDDCAVVEKVDGASLLSVFWSFTVWSYWSYCLVVLTLLCNKSCSVFVVVVPCLTPWNQSISRQRNWFYLSCWPCHSLSVLLAQAELNMPQPDWEWVWAKAHSCKGKWCEIECSTIISLSRLSFHNHCKQNCDWK